MRIHVPHRWTFSPRRAAQLQRELAARVRATRPRGTWRLIAGLDAAFSRDGRFCIGAAVVWDLREGVPVEERRAVRELRFPYLPGLLSFREAPALIAALRKLRSRPDVLLCDGQGWAHPRRFGLACHLGVICEMPAIGCAKSRLIGTHPELPPERGARVPLLDGGERIGTVLRTREGVRPVYVSVGHRIDLASAEELVLSCARRYRLPEPTRLADALAGRIRRQEELW